MRKFDHIIYCTSVKKSKKDESFFKELSTKLDNLTILDRIVTEEDLYPAFVLNKRVNYCLQTLDYYLFQKVDISIFPY